MIVSEERMIDVLRDTVVHSLEGGEGGSQYPALHQYLNMEGDDVDGETVKSLREDFSKVAGRLEGISIVLVEDGQVSPVEKVSCIDYGSPHSPFVMQAGMRNDYDPNSKLREIVDIGLAQCDEAIRRGCGFGKYTT